MNFAYSFCLTVGFFIWVGLRWLVCGGSRVCNDSGEVVVRVSTSGSICVIP